MHSTNSMQTIYYSMIVRGDFATGQRSDYKLVAVRNFAYEMQPHAVRQITTIKVER